jgi:uncharacterized protein YqeY
MNLADKVNEEIKLAMKSRNEARLRAYRNIKSSFLLLQTSGGAVAEEEYMKALQKMAKQRRDSIEIFENESRNDLADKEKEELVIIEELLPAQMSEAEVENKVRELIKQAGASGAKDMGKVMPLAMKTLSGQADGKLISSVIKRLLES